MKLTKEECMKALRYLGDYNGEEYNCHKFANAMEDLHHLIEEHFDNLPLKFEELKEGMWVWDNRYKDYVKLKRHDIENFGKLIIFSKGFDEEYLRSFEENRFYRKEVEQC